MTPDSERLTYLLDRNRTGACTREEMEELYRALSALDDKASIPELEAQFRKIDPAIKVDDIDWDFIYDRVVQPEPGALVQKLPRYRKAGWAAAVLLVGAGTAILWYGRHQQKEWAGRQKAAIPAGARDVQPGREGALLTLADGRTIMLDSIKEGIITRQNGADLLLHDGQLAYSGPDGATKEEGDVPAFNILTTPRGRQFHLILPDGSKVWLNAASSIKYPTRFTGNAREVDISGEAYFDIEQISNKPFRVRTPGQTVEVLGTEFNINAYGDEGNILTTLMRGSVRVKAHGDLSVVLLPGQQSIISGAANADMHPIPVKEADTRQVAAWKNGFFEFNSTDIQAMMRQMERWYDVSVHYPKGIPVDKFKGTISRNVSLSQFLEILKYSDINAKIEGRTVIITP